MRFLQPLGLIGLIGVPILILIYILRSKYNEQTVASTYLWKLSEKFFKRRNPLSGLTGIISLILQILLVTCVSLAIARPVFVVPNSAGEYCFILDGSGSMNTRSDSESYFDMAKGEIEDMIDDARLGSSYTLILASAESSVVYERLTDKDLAIEMLYELEVSDGSVDITDPLSLAQGYFDENSSTSVYFVTDHEYESVRNLQIVNVGLQNATNYALGEVYGELTDGVLSVNGEAISYNSDATLKLNLYVNGSTEPAATESISVIAGEMTPLELSARVDAYSSFRLCIENRDSLDIDNEIVCYNSEEDSAYSILIVSKTPFFLRALFDSLSDATVDCIQPDEYIGQEGYGLYVFHSYTPSELPDAALWLINSSESVEDSGFGVRGIIECEDPSELVKSESSATLSRRLLSGVVGRDIYVGEYVKYSGMYTKFTTLFSLDSNPLIFAGVNALGNREVVFGFDLHKSDLPLSTDFVPLMANLLEYSCPDVLDRSDYICGEEASVNIGANVESLKLISPSGEEKYLDTSSDTASFTLDRVGSYTLELRVSGATKNYKIYSAAPAEESNIAAIGGSLSINGVQTYDKTDGEFDPIAILFVLMAIAFTADWMVYCYEKYQLR